MDAYLHTKLVSLFTLLMAVYFAAQVGKMRGKHGVQAPDCTGPDEFNRVYRAHQNTLEMMILFFPTLWIFASVVNDLYAGIIGAAWIIGRIMYFSAYCKEDGKRGTGFMIAFIAKIIMIIWTIIILALQVI